MRSANGKVSFERFSMVLVREIELRDRGVSESMGESMGVPMSGWVLEWAGLGSYRGPPKCAGV
jgi:hypothetical protein